MTLRIGATARVRLTVEVAISSRWGDDCGMKQVYDQAAEEAIGAIRNICEKAGTPGRITIIGEPLVTAVLAEKAP